MAATEAYEWEWQLLAKGMTPQQVAERGLLIEALLDAEQEADRTLGDLVEHVAIALEERPGVPRPLAIEQGIADHALARLREVVEVALREVGEEPTERRKG